MLGLGLRVLKIRVFEVFCLGGFFFLEFVGLVRNDSLLDFNCKGSR